MMTLTAFEPRLFLAKLGWKILHLDGLIMQIKESVAVTNLLIIQNSALVDFDC